MSQVAAQRMPVMDRARLDPVPHQLQRWWTVALRTREWSLPSASAVPDELGGRAQRERVGAYPLEPVRVRRRGGDVLEEFVAVVCIENQVSWSSVKP